MAEDGPELTREEKRRYVEALETLPSLTRVVFLLSCRDEFPYSQIAWRCGISETDVQIRVGDALSCVCRYMDGQRKLVGALRRAMRPWRIAWAAARGREVDRRLGLRISAEGQPDRRRLIDWMAWAYETVAR